jgi:alpha-D-ribose 1-methylphosphonate 5-phosphate C-P lyase
MAERCPHCGAKMIRITKVLVDGTVIKKWICSREGLCKPRREAKAKWRKVA